MVRETVFVNMAKTYAALCFQDTVLRNMGNWEDANRMRKVVQRVYNRICRYRINAKLPGVLNDLRTYSEASGTTGTQWITLWFAVSGILKHKPRFILESGTGASTLVLAATVQKLKRENPKYDGRIISMESVAEWYDAASANLPEKYRSEVEIVLGPREKFEVAMFRGYCHSNIPKHDYSFILLDAPAYTDEHGTAFCADVFKAMDLSSEPVLHGVVDGRASSVFVLQALFGTRTARYWHGAYAAQFSVPRINFRDPAINTPHDYKCSPLGRLRYVKFRKYR